MEWMKPWGEASEARSPGPWPGIAGLILCLGLGACGGKSGSEEATSNAAESAGPSDGPNMVPFDQLGGVLRKLKAVHAAVAE